ncbi:non-muscle caldesmon isoform X2 [Gadus macrocephalus]|uniref:non-muscle caldesmon isoform X2 n=1 Tax=Gadus macrocephalus TaxID=80720 RepID=UPI0028CB4AEF|nr:non-muscle caldesmon isoform X2 [Gadus macrocephalus]
MNMKTIRPISHQEKENQEQEQLKQRQQEAEQELEVLKRRREERRRVREEELRREEGEELRLAGEEEQRRSLKGQPERRTPAVDRGQSSSQEEGVSPVCPRATPKISERTESLSRSLKKSNSFKKTQPPVLLSRLDDRLEQYANAIETSQQEVRAVRRGSGDLPSPTGPLASRRSVFQAGETPSPSRPAGCKARECLKVGVANLITQWVKASPDSSGKAPPSRPAEVRPGDVMQKKNMWEGIRDTERTGTSGATAGDTSGKKFKFVVTGHGKYQKL